MTPTQKKTGYVSTARTETPNAALQAQNPSPLEIKLADIIEKIEEENQREEEERRYGSGIYRPYGTYP